MAKKRKTCKLNATKRAKLLSALTDAQAHYADLAQVWPSLTPTQRQWALDHCPVLVLLIEVARPFGGPNG